MIKCQNALFSKNVLISEKVFLRTYIVQIWKKFLFLSYFPPVALIVVQIKRILVEICLKEVQMDPTYQIADRKFNQSCQY